MRALVLALALLAPLPAFALSCMAPSVERSFARFEAEDDAYIVVHGRLTFNMKALPKRMTQNVQPPQRTDVTARLKGSSLTKSGFTLPFDQTVTLEVTCTGPWCGGARTGEDVLAFLRKGENGYALAVSPCGGAVFGTPKPAMLKQARQCLTGGTCTAD